VAFGFGGRKQSREFVEGVDPRGRCWDDLRAAHARYLRAIASRNRFAHRYGLELAELVTELLAAVENGRASSIRKGA
jgi:hypothetical protein